MADQSEDRMVQQDINLQSLPKAQQHRSIIADLEESNLNNDPILSRANSRVVEAEDVPPDGGYGWVCTVCVFLINANTWGVNSAWGIFLAHYLADSTFPGATHLEYALIGGLSISQALLISPIVSISVRKLGTQTTLLIGTIFVFLSLLAASFSTRIWHLFLSQGLCFGYGMGFLYIPSNAGLAPWFSTKRSLAVGFATSGAGIGGLVYNLVAGRAIQTVGLPWTYRILAFCTLAANLISTLLFKDRSRIAKSIQAAFNYREYGRVEVLLVIFWGFTTELGYITLLYSLPNYANSIGLTHSQGSVVGAVLNLGLAIGRPIIGYCSDSFGRLNVAGAMTAFCGILCLTMWVPANSYGLLTTFALLAGTCCGIFWGTVVAITAEVVGLQRLPSAFGMICISLVLPTTFAEPIALQIVSTSGYLTSKIIVGIFFLLGATSTWILRSWQINEIEKKARLEHQSQVSTSIGRTSGAQVKHDFWLTPRKMFVTKRV